MADYYSLLARAVGNLPKTASPTVRKAVYERARSALLTQLRAMKPPLPESDILREQTALDAAIARIEAETAAAGVAGPQTATSATALAERPKPPIAARPITTAPSAPATRPMAPTTMAKPSPAPPAKAPVHIPPPPPLTARAEESATQAPSLGGVRNDDEFANADAATTVRLAKEGSRPAAPGLEPEEPPRRTALWLAVGAMGGFVFMVAIAAFFLRQSAQDFIKPPSAAPTAEASAAPAAGKVAQRASAEATPESAPAPSPSPTIIAATAPEPSPVVVATPAPTQATAAPAAPTADVLPVGARAAIVIATSQDPAVRPTLHMGTVVWSQIPAAAGQAPMLKAVADLPDLKGHAEVTIKKNLDTALPASHLIDVKFTFDDGSEIKAVTQMDKPLMHQDDGQRLDPMSGAAVKVGDNHFLVGLAKGDADLSHNLDLIATHSWFDFPIILLDGKVAKLTIEKGTDGEALIAQTLAAWK